MTKLGLLKRVSLMAAVLAAVAVAASAQTFTNLFSFDQTNGAEPTALIRAPDGNFYGTSWIGGTSTNCPNGCGSIFQITPEGVLALLHGFSFTDGAGPSPLIQASDGNFYGTTSQGGAYGCGTIFKFTPDGTLTTLYSFAPQPNCAGGGVLNAGLIQATDGNFYGTTDTDGASGFGTVFTITPQGVFTTLHSFSGPDGIAPHAGLIQATDGKFYGTTSGGGAYYSGTVFQITSAGELTTLYSFCALAAYCPDGVSPQAGLIQATDGNFYGTTYGGGAHGHGTIFEIIGTGRLYTLYSFCNQTRCPDGTGPEGIIQARDGNFYGTTYGGGAHQFGTVFNFSAGTSILVTQHSFDSTDGAYPLAGPIQASDGAFYGTTLSGGGYQFGSVFRLVMAPGVTLSPASLSFGNLALGEISPAKTVQLKNSGTALLNINNIVLSDSTNFAMSPACGPVLAKGKSCSVSVTFAPTALGKLTGSLTITDNAPNSPQTDAISGTGLQPATLIPTTASYSSRTVGTTSPPKTFTLTNNQSVALNNISISTSGDFAVSATTCSTNLAAKGKCSINVTFTPTQTGTRAGQLGVSDSTNNSPQTSNLTGIGK